VAKMTRSSASAERSVHLPVSRPC